MNIDGTCLCGQFAYEAIIDPDKVGICHCTDCQTQSGTAFRYGTHLGKEDFKPLRGELKFYVKTAESGAKITLAFCPECGTCIYAAHAGKQPAYSLRLGTARQRQELTPKAQFWRRSAVAWLGKVDTLMSFDTQPQRRKRPN